MKWQNDSKIVYKNNRTLAWNVALAVITLLVRSSTFPRNMVPIKTISSKSHGPYSCKCICVIWEHFLKVQWIRLEYTDLRVVPCSRTHNSLPPCQSYISRVDQPHESLTHIHYTQIHHHHLYNKRFPGRTLKTHTIFFYKTYLNSFYLLLLSIMMTTTGWQRVCAVCCNQQFLILSFFGGRFCVLHDEKSPQRILYSRCFLCRFLGYVASSSSYIYMPWIERVYSVCAHNILLL